MNYLYGYKIEDRQSMMLGKRGTLEIVILWKTSTFK